MGVSRIRIANFKAIDKMDLYLNEGGINCLLGKNGVGKTTIINAIKYLYKIAENPYDVEQIIDKRNPYVQKATIEIYFDFRSLNKKTRNQYIDEKIGDFEGYIKDGFLPLKMMQYKSGLIEWYPLNDVYKVRKILSVFPVYTINTRDISLYEWSDLWELVSDIAISGITIDQVLVKNNLVNAFQEIYGEKYTKVYEKVARIFREEKVNINEKDYKARFKNAIVTNFGGDIFKIDDQNIGFYSAGMNSLKYITLFLKLITNLADTAWKDITIVIDEPEISLHPQYIDQLADVIEQYNVRNSIILSTHSTHLVSALIRNYADVTYYQVHNTDGYAKIKRMENIFSEKDRYLIGDEEATSYFADVVVLVEGQTEIQLLRNRSIVKLYPFLKKATFYNTKSNDDATSLIIPNATKAVIPFLNIVDMDKIITYSKKKKKFHIKTDNVVVNPLGKEANQEKEKLLFYSDKKKLTYIKRKKINALLKKEFYTDRSQFCLFNYDYFELISSIKKYCKQYNCIPLRTTIEGAIVCANSYDIILEWIQCTWKEETYQKLIRELSGFNSINQLAILRCIFHGKLDTLLKYGDKQGNNVEDKVYDIIKEFSAGKKVDGWIFEFFNWYFEFYMTESDEKNRQLFEKTFPEINEILQFIKSMIEYRSNEQ